uniref:CLU central domain-containing protein n=1 Tax=Fagus sylvatica TaxID=28930 RepID=A0A2N9JB23_FAGSY
MDSLTKRLTLMLQQKHAYHIPLALLWQSLQSIHVAMGTGNTLDPRPSKTSSEATTLVGLLQKISSKFKKAFREILERRASAHPFENVQSLLPPNSWLGLHLVPEHKRDAARAEDALTLSYGSELIGMQRDWNEELQSCREFPHTTPQERYLISDAVLEAAKRLHLKEHTVLDGSGNVFKLAAPVECKGDAHVTTDSSTVVGVDEQVRMVANATAAFDCLIVVFLLGLNCILEGKKKTLAAAVIVGNITKEGRDENVKDCASSQAETEPREEILFNPNVFTEFKLSWESRGKSGPCNIEIVEDEENVRKVSSYLTNVVLPKFVQDLCTLEVSPMDGQTLTEALHAHGINVRYIGKVADGTKHLPHLWDLCSNEIVVRSAKHILKDVLRDIEDHDIAGAISHFFNCFFGTFQAVGTKVTANNMQSRTHRKDQGGHQSSGKPSRGQGRWKGGASARKNQSSFMNVSSETLWSDIQELAKLKYQIELPEDARSRVKKVSVIRNLCQKVIIS